LVGITGITVVKIGVEKGRKLDLAAFVTTTGAGGGGTNELIFAVFGFLSATTTGFCAGAADLATSAFAGVLAEDAALAGEGVVLADVDLLGAEDLLASGGLVADLVVTLAVVLGAALVAVFATGLVAAFTVALGGTLAIVFVAAFCVDLVATLTGAFAFTLVVDLTAALGATFLAATLTLDATLAGAFLATTGFFAVATLGLALDAPATGDFTPFLAAATGFAAFLLALERDWAFTISLLAGTTPHIKLHNLTVLINFSSYAEKPSFYCETVLTIKQCRTPGPGARHFSHKHRDFNIFIEITSNLYQRLL
jgi:hypothetical protein